MTIFRELKQVFKLIGDALITWSKNLNVAGVPEVAFVVGSGLVELFSPDGKCGMVLAPIPQTTPIHRPPLAYIDNNLYVCGVLNLGKL